MMQFLSYILFGLAAMCNAFMDTSVDHFPESIFSKLNPQFWEMQVSWKYSKTIFGYHIDAWHIAKSIMVIAIILALIVKVQTNLFSLNSLIDILVYGFVWNAVFILFYNKIFLRRL